MTMNGKACIHCQIEMRVLCNGALIVEMGATAPLAVYAGDLWYCPGCESRHVIGVGAEPIAHHPSYEQLRELNREQTTKPMLRIWSTLQERKAYYEANPFPFVPNNERAFAHIREWAERSAAVREWKPGSWGAHAVVTMQDEARETIVGEDAPGGVG